MIMRLYLITSLLLLGVTAFFVVVWQEPGFQAAPASSSLVQLQKQGLLPTGPFGENEDIEHGIFDVPMMDETMLEAAMQNMDMGGMDMGGMDMGEGQSPDGTMTMPDGSTMPMADMGMAPASEESAEAGTGTMTMPDGTTMPMADMGMPGAADGAMGMAAACIGETGLGFCPEGAEFDREIDLTMSEWTFSDLEVEVKQGERIRFNVRNDGKILHEFMFMTMPLMQAATYRARRADWNLLEHEALYEKSLLLPGETLTFVAEVQSTGSWMFMCMLPYHMQMGMMGQIATPGAAMQM